MAPSLALVKRNETDLSLMPPPPTKRIKRPATVLDEDEYTDALADIITRDYFPGLAEAKAQEEYLSALESKNEAWIAEAGQKLRDSVTSKAGSLGKRSSRDTRYDTTKAWQERTPVPDTPRGNASGETPVRKSMGEDDESLVGKEQKREVDTSNLSLSQFQAKYTSEDNESFNTVLDKQNDKHRQKHAYLWTKDQRIPSNRLITHRTNEMKLLQQKDAESAAAAKTDVRALIPITTGAISSRPAQPDTWRQRRPDNTFMFNATSIDEDGLQTVMEMKEANSKAGPKEVVYANTRFPPLTLVDDPGPVPPSPSLNTTIIANRDAARANRADSESIFSGNETPRVNGYAFVDEDEPENMPQIAAPSEPSYRDLLAGQVSDSQPNPFKMLERSKRESLHYRLVEKDKAKRRAKEKETLPMAGGRTPVARDMTPAARKLMEKLGQTPIASQKTNVNVTSHKDMWTPGNTPRRR